MMMQQKRVCPNCGSEDNFRFDKVTMTYRCRDCNALLRDLEEERYERSKALFEANVTVGNYAEAMRQGENLLRERPLDKSVYRQLLSVYTKEFSDIDMKDDRIREKAKTTWTTLEKLNGLDFACKSYADRRFQRWRKQQENEKHDITFWNLTALGLLGVMLILICQSHLFTAAFVLYLLIGSLNLRNEMHPLYMREDIRSSNPFVFSFYLKTQKK